jgi:hypothetical protein
VVDENIITVERCYIYVTLNICYLILIKLDWHLFILSYSFYIYGIILVYYHNLTLKSVEPTSLSLGSGVGVSFFSVCGIGLAVLLWSVFDKSGSIASRVRKFVISMMTFSFSTNPATLYQSDFSP